MKNGGNIDFSEEALGALWDSEHGDVMTPIVGRGNHGDRVDYKKPIDGERVRKATQDILRIILTEPEEI